MTTTDYGNKQIFPQLHHLFISFIHCCHKILKSYMNTDKDKENVPTQPINYFTTKKQSIFSKNWGQDLTNFISTLFYTSIIRKICQVSPEY